MELIFNPIQEKFVSRKRSPHFVIWRVKSTDKSVEANIVKGNTQYKAIKGRYMRATGQLVNDPKFGVQFNFTDLKIAATVFHDSLCRAISRRMSPFRRSNEDLCFNSIKNLPVSDIVSVWKGDIPEIRRIGMSLGNASIQDAFSKLANDLEINGDDVQPQRYGSDLITFQEWWRILCWGSCFQMKLPEIVDVFLTGKDRIDIDELKSNPYRILSVRTEFTDSSDFLSWMDWVDYVARSLGKSSRENKIEAVVQSSLLYNCWDQHSMYMTKQELLRSIGPSSDFYMESYGNDVKSSEFDAALASLNKSGSIIVEDEAVYPAKSYNDEVDAAKYLVDRKRKTIKVKTALDNEFDLAIQKLKDAGKEPNEKQKKAIRLPFENDISMISGLPGTGKTFVTKPIIDIATGLGWTVGLVTPTGIAAKNIKTASGHDAATIHRTFGWKEGDWVFRQDGNRAQDFDLLIIDEISMLSTDLFMAAVRGTWDRASVLIIGDAQQIPSISPGNVFKSLLQTGLPHVHLDDIHRQAQESGIIRMAHDISKNSLKNLASYAPEVQHVQTMNYRNALDILKNHLIPQDVDPSKLQLITPTNIGPLGTQSLNKELADKLNPGDRIYFGYKGFRVGDKVVVTKNNYDLNVYNGDIGILRHVTQQGAELEIFGNTDTVEIPVDVLAEHVELAYAITIHKAQGSEFEHVIAVFDPRFKKMIYKNLLYTAVTRASKRLDLVVDESDFRQLAQTPESGNRNSRLTKRVKELLANKK